MSSGDAHVDASRAVLIIIIIIIIIIMIIKLSRFSDRWAGSTAGLGAVLKLRRLQRLRFRAVYGFGLRSPP